MADAFDRIQGRDSAKGDAFDRFPVKEEGFWKSAARTATQPLLGVAEVSPLGIAGSLWQAFGQGDTLDPEEIEHIRRISEREGIPFDEEAYRESAQQAQSMVPSVSNISRELEEQTGIPLEPKEWYQKALRLGSSVGKLTPGTATQKITAGVVAPATSQALQAAGVNEGISDIVGFAAGGWSGIKSPKIDVSLTSKKPSGLTERQFENIKKPRDVSQGKLEKINRKLESDFRDISGKIIEESPLGDTAKNLATDAAYKQESRELLNQAQEIANKIPESISAKDIKKTLADRASKQTKGFALSEYEKNYNKFMSEAIKDIKSKDVTHGRIVEQYRKNNSSLSEYFEPGSPKALNNAKKDALLDQNRAIAEVIEKSNPELSKVFKEGNERWTKIMDAEAVDEFVNKMFTGKVNYKEMHNFFDKNGYDRMFKRALGEKGYKDFEVLMKDMLSSEAPYKMLKVAQGKGLEDVAKTGLGYVIHPKLGMAKATWDLSKAAYKSGINLLLDNPKLTLTWKNGLDALKKGDFKTAEKEFTKLNSASEAKKVESLKKFNDHKNSLKHANEDVIVAQKEGVPK